MTGPQPANRLKATLTRSAAGQQFPSNYGNRKCSIFAWFLSRIGYSFFYRNNFTYIYTPVEGIRLRIIINVRARQVWCANGHGKGV